MNGGRHDRVLVSPPGGTALAYGHVSIGTSPFRGGARRKWRAAGLLASERAPKVEWTDGLQTAGHRRPCRHKSLKGRRCPKNAHRVGGILALMGIRAATELQSEVSQSALGGVRIFTQMNT